MKLPNLFLSMALMSTVSCLSSTIYATEVRSGGRAGGDRDASAPLLQHTRHKARDQHVAEGGAERLKERQLAADGAERLRERQVAADGSDRLQQNQIAEGGSDRLIENRVADNSATYGAGAVASFCLACR
ncbi:hypothetical protein PS684_01640 [Pseudomonas fluorescens]|uniref:hypothetical protein n=1 Tax=Pseudomonas tensinigenes TaxID=2745511 RepID=UPI00125A5E2D|nr:hypothetical protein [Pseudomonas tensinigenes]VVM87853.1 hypothetical protein PS681_02643 [Pseudomonas fluorescens]VVN54205.1 hypothetical protein PS684_01640 [Pseudomonas fluorescens]